METPRTHPAGTPAIGNWYYGWNILGTAMLFQAATYGLSLYSFTFWVDPWVQAFDASRGDLMLAILFAQILAGCIAPFAGRALDTLSIRYVVVGGLLLFGTGHALVGLATAVWHVVVLYTLFTAIGLVAAGSMAGQTLVVKWFRRRRGVALGWVTIGTSIGGFCLPPLAALLLTEIGWRAAHGVLGAGVILLVAPVVWLMIRNSPEAEGLAPEPPSLLGDGSFPTWTTASILRSRNFWALILVLLPSLTAMNAVQMNLAPIARDLGVGPQYASFMMSLLAGAMIAGKLFFGMMADRWDHRVLFLLSLAFMATALALLTGAPGYPVLLLISALLGLAAGGFLPLIGAVVGSRFGPASFGRVRGLTAPFITISAIGAPIAGKLRDVTGSYEPALWLFLASLALALLAIAVLMRPVREPATAASAAGKA